VRSPLVAVHMVVRSQEAMAWELLIASLRIPRAHAEFASLCSDPPAMREAAGLHLFPPSAAAALGEIKDRPRPPRGGRKIRR
jgi:hypothetical protein